MSVNTDLSSIKETLSSSGLKVTHQRLVIYRAVLKSKEHPTAEMVFDRVRLENPSISLGTVYKTLETFVAAGLLHKAFSSGGYLRYDANISNHHHIYCENTEEILDFEDQELSDLIDKYLKKKRIKNLKIRNVTIQINGEKQDINSKVLIN